MKSKVSFMDASERVSQKLNITSLMDVLTIILIFLLVNYSSVEQDMDVPDFIKMPLIKTQTLENVSNTLKVIVGKDRFRVNDAPTIDFSKAGMPDEESLERLAEAMAKIKKDNELNKVKSVLAIQADEDVPYEYIDGVILGAAAVGITQIELMSLKQQD